MTGTDQAPAAADVAADSDRIALPSGLVATLHEVLTDRPGFGLVYRFRFVSEGLDPKASGIDVIAGDLEHLCRTYALGRLADLGPVPSQVVISLSDRPTEFGIKDPAAREVFEAFSVSDGTCILEMF